jgi:hypothetical protein
MCWKIVGNMSGESVDDRAALENEAGRTQKKKIAGGLPET